MRGEGRGPVRNHAGQAGQYLAVPAGQQHRDLVLDLGPLAVFALVRRTQHGTPRARGMTPIQARVALATRVTVAPALILTLGAKA